jgi:SAM-dependent methyltransferase
MEKRGAKIYGIDLKSTLVEYVREETNKRDVRFPVIQQGDISEGIKVFKTKFDLIYFSQVIYYLTEKEIIILFEECFEILNQGGNLIILTVTGDFEIKNGKEIQSNSINDLQSPKNPVMYQNEDFFDSLLSKAGFHNINKKKVTETFLNCTKLRKMVYFCTTK